MTTIKGKVYNSFAEYLKYEIRKCNLIAECKPERRAEMIKKAERLQKCLDRFMSDYTMRNDSGEIIEIR